VDETGDGGCILPVQRLTYGLFGEILEDTRPGRQPFAYAGGLYDHETGLTRFGAREEPGTEVIFSPSGSQAAESRARFSG
jgi:hypothetical protein